VTRTPTLKLDGGYTVDEVALVIMAVRPEDLPSDGDREATEHG